MLQAVRDAERLATVKIDANEVLRRLEDRLQQERRRKELFLERRLPQ